MKTSEAFLHFLPSGLEDLFEMVKSENGTAPYIQYKNLTDKSNWADELVV